MGNFKAIIERRSPFSIKLLAPRYVVIHLERIKSLLNREDAVASRLDMRSARPTATKPAEIAEMFNTYFASVFTTDNLPDSSEESSTDPHMTELIIIELEVEHMLKTLDSNKATGPDGIPARLLKVTIPNYKQVSARLSSR
jgi:hypothetical protein